MDLNTVSEVARPATREEIGDRRDGDAWLAGGTWLFSEPQPGVRRLIDLEGLRWGPLTETLTWRGESRVNKALDTNT